VTQPPIPIIRPTLRDRESCFADFESIWSSGQITSGPFVARFEDALKAYLGVADAVCLGSCTSGLMLLQRALGLSGEVIVPTFTWTATGTSLLWNNCTPVFVDARPGDLTLDPDKLEAAITPQTQAICPVAVFGVPSDRAEIEAIAKRYNLPVYYDSAQALGATYHGARVGGSGTAEVFSLSPTKVVTAIEMGVVTTNDRDLAARLRRMRDYGKSADSEDIAELGLSVRPSEFHAVVGYYNLRHIDELVAHRGKMIALYQERLAGCPGISFQTIPVGRTTSNNYAVILVGPESNASRDVLYDALQTQEIGCKRYFYPCLHQQTVFKNATTRNAGSLDIAECASAEALALPLYGHIPDDEVNRVADAVIAVCS
jgi:dTDP-4-amino-4,6-dideoxygalactose transaminase